MNYAKMSVSKDRRKEKHELCKMSVSKDRRKEKKNDAKKNVSLEVPS